ncbi:MAG: thiamine pyrophosphate-binding protein [Jatrophihabitans sp.]
MTTTPAHAIATALASERVRYLFGMPGGGNNLDVIGACEAEGITFVLAHTETGAAIMASAYAELTDTVGACVVTRGPGAASVVNGAAQAQQDRQPLLVICDTVDQASSSRIAHQNIDQQAMFAPVTTWSGTVGATDPDNVMRTAIHAARTPPCGAVHLDVDPSHTGTQAAPAAPPGRQGSMDELAALLAGAGRPVIVVGLGARSHGAAIRELVAGTSIPVLMTYKAKGLVPDSGPNSAGAFTGSQTDGAVLEAADLIITLGLDSIELIPNPWTYSAAVLALAETCDSYRYFEPDVAVVGPLAELIAMLPDLPDHWPTGFGAKHRLAIVRDLLDGPVRRPGIAPWDVVRIARASAAGTSIATVDAGAHMLVAMALWSTEGPGQVMISSGLATMGYAVPAAVGAALARPDVRVYCFVGDGGLMMCLGELETIARLGLSITIIVFNDRTLSLIKAKQRADGHGGLDAVQYTLTDFAVVAQGLGLPSATAFTDSEFASAVSADGPGPLLIDVRIDAENYRHVIDVVRQRSAR